MLDRQMPKDRSRGSLARRLSRALACVGLVMLGTATGAMAAGPASSPLPGYPRFRGVMLVHDGSAASNAREKAVRSALKAASSSTSPNCTLAETNPGADLCFWGGPVVRSHTVHLIFWEGPGGLHRFPANYVARIEAYFASVTAASKTVGEANSSVYTVGTQYAGSNGAVSFNVGFASPVDVYVEKTEALPAGGVLPTECRDGTFTTCITDEDLRSEITHAQTAEAANGWKSSREDIYFVFTPPSVGSCFGPGSSSEGDPCALVEGGYCAYHSDFGATGKETLYANMPDGGEVPGCDSFEHPNGAGGVDATIDAASHEHNETITDPLSKEPAWLDVIGQEIADKCLPPETFDIYGGPFGGVPAEFDNTGKVVKTGTLYNQMIGGGHYWLQREWSNTAFNGEGGCVARMLHTEFAPPTEAKATVPATFDGSASGESGDPAVYWVWAFGDGMQVGTPEPTVPHTYATPGAREVTLTAFDRYGNSNTHKAIVEVGAAPPPVSPPPLSPPAPTTLTKLVTVPAEPTAYTAAQLAAKLGLPADGKTLSGAGTISLGHAECPPACGVTLQLYATVRTTKRHRTTVKRVSIGLLHTTIAGRGTGALALSLNANGRALLRKRRSLACKLVVTVEGQEGGTWQIVRTVTLTSSGSAARHARR